MLLTLDPIVNVNVMVGASEVSLDSYDVGLIIAPPTSALTAAIRAKSYTSLAEIVADGYAATSDTYKAAAKYFGTEPAPSSVVIGVIDSSETVAVALDAIRDVNPDWYGVYMVGATDENIADIVAYLNSINHGMLFFAKTGTVASATADSGIFATLLAGGSKRYNGHYTSGGVEEAAAVMGAAMGYSNAYASAMWALCYKRIAGLTPTPLTQSEVTALGAVHANVYVTRGRDLTVYERGFTGSVLRTDEVIVLDKIAGEIQTELLTMLTGDEKFPQEDSTTSRFTSAVADVLEKYRAIGYIAPGVWNGASFGSVENGQALERGYAIYADTFDNQSQADRNARKAMPITVGICLSGSVESVVINVIVQQ